MSGKLEVRLSQYLLGPSAAQGAVATVYPLESGSEASRQTFVISAGSGEARLVEVPAGRYLVEARLPSGETVAKEVEVGEGGHEPVDLQGKGSDHEWLSWQRLVGNVGRGAAAVSGVEAPTAGGPEEARAGDAAPPMAGLPVARWIADPADPLRGDRNSADAWELLAKAIDVTSRTVLGHLAPRGAKRMEASDGDRDHQLYRLCGDGAAPSSQPIRDQGSPLPRRYLLVESRDWIELVCAPVPWYNQATSEQSVVEVLVRAAPAHGEAASATALRDSDFGAALSYMTIGALSEARQIYEQARDMLFGKVVNPLAAAGGGYVLLGTDPAGEAADWPDWIENLRTWFPWLPDGSIQAGWLKLKRRRDQADVDDARAAFHEAVQRGLPFYSMGIQRLVEGLTMFEGDPETDRLLAQVQSVAWHANLQQPFTTLRLKG
ncbi:MAG TPA: carboxypeptidase-like regulatory domain-containing protein [Candidatus Limnocylindria bacterium]|nr:carboxypeptidase-like regulatory domain-containing protein [Candidatus Limnocylindria bacterium]